MLSLRCSLHHHDLHPMNQASIDFLLMMLHTIPPSTVLPPNSCRQQAQCYFATYPRAYTSLIPHLLSPTMLSAADCLFIGAVDPEITLMMPAHMTKGQYRATFPGGSPDAGSTLDEKPLTLLEWDWKGNFHSARNKESLWERLQPNFECLKSFREEINTHTDERENNIRWKAW
ncbi:hypothetical protein BP00DRAFT_258072 [Aspergillus indologenus CBS 114.80]|uniref:Uncharacterized protein n=1 Tax=Aspergillus indologenus CBS 114.80 TaxID=1450541 RepID=A0A2V5I2N9_9EURO|nr:hypothetical protein BP00DRAFT_258072 [Aspergillus indologenus CBS 114.80]